jgi:anti-sigma regulatory factor (Ser/Thr protein kinase)
MTITSDETLAVTEGSQIGQARRAAVKLAEASKLSEAATGAVAIIATELARNLARYGKDGRLFVQSVRGPEGSFVQVLAIDAGPGIPDLQRSMQDGVSTGGTPGTGLGAVRRMSDDFDIYSTVGRGTLVFSRVGKSRSKRTPAYRWAAISTAAPGETVCGDAWRIAENDGELSAMVVDGLGHGPRAAEASARAVALFDGETERQPGAFCTGAHKALGGSRGAALAIAHVSAPGRVRYAGVGNIAGAIVDAESSRGLASQNGTVGVQIRRVQEFDYELNDGGILVMHSDGLSNRWSLTDYYGLASRHPALIAGVLYRDFMRGRDDATIVVVKRRAAKGPEHESRT